MGSIVTRMKTVAWLAVGLVPLLGPLPLGAAAGLDSPETSPLSEPKSGQIAPAESGQIAPAESGQIAPAESGQIAPAESGPLSEPKIAVQETAREVRIELPGDVLFDFDKSDIRPDAEPTLRQVAEIIQRYPKAKVAIAGYTDAKGADAYNLPLSARRAESVKAWLVQQGGVDGKRMTTKGWGEAKPVAPNTHTDGSDNPEGRQKNRRVELTVKK
jgi:outer membrane protein OmpA-like peptidoglycan-associated protein